MSSKNCDFAGYATRNDLKCADGRVIRKDAFKDCDGKTVPLVWNHDHSDPMNVLGHALLENRVDGVYAYASFNDTEAGQAGKILVQHGDVTGLSIYANRLQQKGSDVLHGMIREVSLVLAGANPGAYIEEVMAHGEGEEVDECVFGYVNETAIELQHAEEQKKEEEEPEVADEKKNDSEKTVKDVIDSMNEEQKTVMYALIGQALEESGVDENEEEENVKHNVFETDERQSGNVICHADQEKILTDAKRCGSFREAFKTYTENYLQHDDEDDVAPVAGFTDESLALLFPEFKDVRPGEPELITYDQGWVTRVMSGVHKTPFSRIRTRQVDIRGIDTLKAKGYVKGHPKALTGKYSEARRTTDPQTVYVRSTLNRDDIVDLTDFDYVAYQYKIDRLQLNETLALAMFIGDEREDDDPDKIFPSHIRPIWTDDELFTIHGDVDFEQMAEELQGDDTEKYFGENFIYAEAIIQKALYLREQYKGSGRLTMYADPHIINIMLLARDRDGHRMYKTKDELRAALNVVAIEEVEQFANKTREIAATATTEAATKKLLAIFVDMNDYNVGSTKGGEITHFNQFDIDFNQEKSLLETRCSGALIRIKSAIVLEEDVTSSNP